MKVLDTLSGSLKSVPKTKRPLELFVCGPTVYDSAHLGHARTYLAFDLFVRWLRHLDYKVNYLQNITDIDDKIIDRAHQQKISPADLARKFAKLYQQDIKALNIVSVDKYVKASSVIPEIKDQISRLIKKGYAYETELGVYFRVRRFKAYGRLSGQDLNSLRHGYRIEPDTEKEDVLDFALWKKQKSKLEPAWPSPWGPGRPGWHIEDTAIAEKYFGLHYDLHGGAADLKFPHHEAEIAQAEALSGKSPFVKIWLHTGFLTIAGAKMSKSLHNFITVNKFLENHHPDVLRWLVLSRHYRSPFDYTNAAVSESASSLLSIKSFLSYLGSSKGSGAVRSKISILVKKFESRFSRALANDFNTPEALATTFSLINSVNQAGNLNKHEAAIVSKAIREIFTVLGFNLKFRPLPAKVKKLILEREAFRIRRDFSKADKLRAEINSLGYQLDDTPSGPVAVLNDLVKTK